MEIQCTEHERAMLVNALAIILCNDCPKYVRDQCKKVGEQCNLHNVKWNIAEETALKGEAI